VRAVADSSSRVPRRRTLVDAPPAARAARAFMVALGVSQSQLAAQLGIDGGTLSHLLNGRLPHRADLMQKVWVALTASTEARG